MRNGWSDEYEIPQQFESRPVACKLTDFGESPYLIVQTQSFVASRTNIDLGTVVYEAPELFVKEMLLSDASIGDFMLADIWALDMIFFFDHQSKCRVPLPFGDQIGRKCFFTRSVKDFDFFSFTSKETSPG